MMPPAIVALTFFIFALATYAIQAIDQVTLSSISQPASLKFLKSRSNLAILGTDNQNDIIFLEINTIPDSIERSTPLQQQRSFLLELRRPKRFIAETYEEVVHDVSGAKDPLAPPALTVTRPRNIDTELHNCLYRGKISNDSKSFVSISTCNGQIGGWIKTGIGEHFSIENSGEQESHITTGRKNTQSISALQTQRYLARSGQFEQLSQHIPTIQLVDVLAESKLEEQLDNIRQQQQQQYHHRNHLNFINQQVRDDNQFSKLINSNDKSLDLISSPDRIDQRLAGSNCPSRQTSIEILRKKGLNDDDLQSISNHHSNLQILNDDNDNINHSDDANARKYLRYPQRYVECVIYHDYARLQFFNTTAGLTIDDLIAASKEDALLLFNNIITYYEHSQFLHNVTFILKGHVFFSTGDPYTKYRARGGGILVVSGSGLLENFNKYRSYYGHGNHDIGILLSGNPFQSNIKGVANIGSICGGTRYNGNINSVTYRSRVLSSVLTSHECGHVLNAQHDQYKGHIMYPYVTSDTSFSPQSKRSIDWMLNRTFCTINNPFPQSHGEDSEGKTNNAFSFLSTAIEEQFAPKKHPVSYIYSSMTHKADRHDVINEDIKGYGYELALDNVPIPPTTTTQYSTLSSDTVVRSTTIIKPARSIILFVSLIASSVCLLTLATLSTCSYFIARKYGAQIMQTLTQSVKSVDHELRPSFKKVITPSLIQQQQQQQDKPLRFTFTIPPSHISPSHLIAKHSIATRQSSNNIEPNRRVDSSGIVFEGSLY